MNRTMMTATNTLNQLQSKIDQISNNIANVDTTAYKKTQTSFNDLLTQSFNNQPNESKEKGRLTAPGIRQGTGAMLSQSQLVLSQGAIKTTDRNLDTALTKEDQFFTVSVQDSKGSNTRLTRDGAFYLSPNANNPDQMMLVTSAGHQVLDEKGNPILIDGNITNMKISDNGVLTVDTEEYGSESFGLGIVSVKKPQFLDRLGGKLLGLPENINNLGVTVDDIMTSLIGDSRDQIAVRQGALESSNVDLSKEMSDLINVQRSYQFQSRSITMADQMGGLINGIR
ncbi:flagellar hook-basal body protein [Peribacillus muralis]|uniref:flagellar hook-basal body protein n=1 Tax=Peribacillus muralis TaxID=264697 RepID=UPI001F4DBC54|nr:flagellar hook-basal body protein [Peribacillus muralis]MCK1994509.1 flagellar hook-basal body protein [Peribacillus muralis]MCK2015257.1 flagellar hook-basal body protein [Peribacillus muralis]